jgi:hypothetical protein
MDECLCGSARAAPKQSWDKNSRLKIRFPKTRDCQSIAGFLFGKNCARLGVSNERKNMSARSTRRKVPAKFGPETRFEIKPLAAGTFRAVQENRFERLKAELLAARLEAMWEPELNSQIRRAANEAAALAWVTPYPLLVFPVLFEEKAEAALRISERQEEVRRRTRELLAV